MNPRRLLAASFNLVALWACSAAGETQLDAGGTQAASEAAQGPLGLTPSGHLRIADEALGPTFLLQSTGLFESPGRSLLSPDILSLNNSLVRFERGARDVLMVELDTARGALEVPTSRLRRRLPLVAEAEGAVVVAWDGPGALLRANAQGPDGLELEEVLPEPEGGLGGLGGGMLGLGLGLHPSRAYHRLSPYRPDPSFVPRPSRPHPNVGVLPAAFQPLSPIAAWDLRPEAGPIAVLVSDQVPVPLEAAVVAGLEYWNQVAGRQVLQVFTGAKVGFHPRPRTVMVHWVSDPFAMKAHTAISADPLTGEMLGALLQITPLTGPPAPFQGPWPTRLTASFAAGWPRALLAEVGPEALRRGRDADRTRLVVAHEMGHALGLAHNFAGSYAHGLPSAADSARALKAYRQEPDHRGLVVATTVMDYLDNDHMLLLGRALAALENPLPYDVLAIDSLYGDAARTAGWRELPPYCSDVEVEERVVGCGRFDASANPAAYCLSRLADRRLVASGLWGRMLLSSAGAWDALLTGEMAAPALEPLNDALDELLEPHAICLQESLHRDARLLLPVVAHEPHRPLRRVHSGPLLEAAQAKMSAEMGGLAGALERAWPVLDGAELEAVRAELRAHLNAARVAAGDQQAQAAAEGQPAWALVAPPEAMPAALLAYIEARYPARLMTLLTKGPVAPPNPNPLAALFGGGGPSPRPASYPAWLAQRQGWPEALYTYVHEILTAEDDGPRPPWAAPQMRYSAAVRRASVHLVTDTYFGDVDVMKPVRDRLIRKVRSRREAAVKARRSLAEDLELEPVDLDDDFAAWAKEEGAVVDALVRAGQAPWSL